jgi:glucose/arabinose dehydrogenase
MTSHTGSDFHAGRGISSPNGAPVRPDRRGRDGLLYVLTDEEGGAVLRIEGQ